MNRFFEIALGRSMGDPLGADLDRLRARKAASIAERGPELTTALRGMKPVDGLAWVEAVLIDWLPLEPDRIRELAMRLDRAVSRLETEREAAATAAREVQ